MNCRVSGSKAAICRDDALSPIPEVVAPQSGAIACAKARPGGSSLESGTCIAKRSAEEAHQGGDAAPSCRLCLIACNSRQIDESGVRV